MKKILLIATIYRVGERIYPIIPELSKEFKVDVLKTAQMGNKITWYGRLRIFSVNVPPSSYPM